MIALLKCLNIFLIIFAEIFIIIIEQEYVEANCQIMEICM